MEAHFLYLEMEDSVFPENLLESSNPELEVLEDWPSEELERVRRFL